MMHTDVTSETKPFKPGDKVVLTIAGAERRAVVLEDRGPLGLNGEQILAVMAEGDPEDWFETFASIARHATPS